MSSILDLVWIRPSGLGLSHMRRSTKCTHVHGSRRIETYYYTVWKLENFSATFILREIDLVNLECSKNCHF